VFIDVPKSTLRSNNGLNAVLGPLLGGPDCTVSPSKNLAWHVKKLSSLLSFFRKSEFSQVALTVQLNF
jgi:hypothetical protein